MAKLFQLVRPVRDTHGKIHPKDQKVRLHREVNTMSGVMFEMIDAEGNKFLTIPEEFTVAAAELGEE